MEIYKKYSLWFHMSLATSSSSTDLLLQKISDIFDGLVVKLRADKPDLDSLSPRRRALAAVQFLRTNNLTGIASELQFRDLQNNYIGIALQDPEHPSLPLISVAIFCAVAQRLGLNAHCCGFPNHVHAIVYPNADETLDGKSLPEGADTLPPMYLDPYRSEAEVLVEDLRTQLVAWGIKDGDFHQFLGDSSTRNIVLRTSRNILATVHDFRGLGGSMENSVHPTIRLHANPFADMDNAFYSALWANFLLCIPPLGLEANEQAQFLPMILERFEKLYPMDASLIERYVCPPFRSVSNAEQWQLFETLRVVRAGDSMPKQVRSRRSPASQRHVKYKIGQVFLHRRYGYTAVITGWDIECNMPSEWMAQNQIDTLDKGRHQSFYHAL
jgi:F-box protein 21